MATSKNERYPGKFQNVFLNIIVQCKVPKLTLEYIVVIRSCYNKENQPAAIS